MLVVGTVDGKWLGSTVGQYDGETLGETVGIVVVGEVVGENVSVPPQRILFTGTVRCHPVVKFWLNTFDEFRLKPAKQVPDFRKVFNAKTP